MSWTVKMDKPFFVGQRSLAVFRAKPLQRTLVGFCLPKGYAGPIPKECHLVIDQGKIAGRVTSVTLSPTLGHVIGMAYVKPEQSQPGNTIEIRVDQGQIIQANIVRTPFYDPDHLRQTKAAPLQEVS